MTGFLGQSWNSEKDKIKVKLWDTPWIVMMWDLNEYSFWLKWTKVISNALWNESCYINGVFNASFGFTNIIFVNLRKSSTCLKWTTVNRHWTTLSFICSCLCWGTHSLIFSAVYPDPSFQRMWRDALHGEFDHFCLQLWQLLWFLLIVLSTAQ